MDLHGFSTKDIGNLGERVAEEYFRRHGFMVLGRNIRSRFGEIDIVAKSKADSCLHIVEVKARTCVEFPDERLENAYDPGDNLHARKIRKLGQMALWYVAMTNWEGEWQIDGLVIWLRKWDGIARVRHFPQLL